MAKRMPALFVGHGSPMNAIENNIYSRNWEELSQTIPKPEAILSISAHWYTEGSKINDTEAPETIYDMYGFPEELYRVDYRVKGAPELAHMTQSIINRKVEIDNTWGIDHGTWSVLKRMYPKADIPVYQLSVDKNASPEVHYEIGKQISILRDRGVMIFGSGNVVHNLARVNWEVEGGYPWAIEFDEYIKDKIINNKYIDVINYCTSIESAKLAFSTPEHFYPLLYILGATCGEDQLRVFNASCTLGSLSMTSYLFK